MQTLAPIAHLAQLRGLEAGLHAYLELGTSISATHVALLCQKRNVIILSIPTIQVLLRALVCF
ncbi:hypothetical protein [Dictyobacter arantiisoli]|nr:hypothetical protein [Dictyobacter arantiisoli]